jgi:hypothetical protein
MSENVKALSSQAHRHRRSRIVLRPINEVSVPNRDLRVLRVSASRADPEQQSAEVRAVTGATEGNRREGPHRKDQEEG